MLHHGSLLYLWRVRGVLYTRVYSRIHWLFDTTGCQSECQCTCNEPFTVEHALSCPKGTFPIHHHNEIRDITHCLLSEVVKNLLWSRSCNHLMGTPSDMHLLSLTTMRDPTYRPRDSGEPPTSVYFLMLRFSTPTHHSTRGSLSLLAMHTMSRSSNACMNKESKTSS